MDDNLYNNPVNDRFKFTVKNGNIQNKLICKNISGKSTVEKKYYNVRMQDNADQREVLAVVNEIEVGQAHITYADTG